MFDIKYVEVAVLCNCQEKHCTSKCEKKVLEYNKCELLNSLLVHICMQQHNNSISSRTQRNLVIRFDSSNISRKTGWEITKNQSNSFWQFGRNFYLLDTSELLHQTLWCWYNLVFNGEFVRSKATVQSLDFFRPLQRLIINN